MIDRYHDLYIFCNVLAVFSDIHSAGGRIAAPSRMHNASEREEQFGWPAGQWGQRTGEGQKRRRPTSASQSTRGSFQFRRRKVCVEE